MKAVVVGALLASASSSSMRMREVTPVQKVVHLMEKMLEKGKTEKHGEQVQFAAHKQFCDDTSLQKQRAMAEAEQTIIYLQADIQKSTSDATLLQREISGLDKDISVWNGDVKAATNVREIEKCDHEATHKSYSETTDALQRAIAVLKDAADDRKHKQASLAQAAQNQTSSHKVPYQPPASSGAFPRAVAVLKKAAHDRTQKNAPRAKAGEIQIDHESTHKVQLETSDRLRIMKKLIPDSSALDRKQKEISWAVVMKKLIPDTARKAIDEFLQQGEYEADDLGNIWSRLLQQGEHDAKFQSHDVIELLEKLSFKFVDERTRLEKEETNSKHSYEMLMQDLNAQIGQAATDRGQKAETKAKKLQAKADASGDLKDTMSTLQTDQKYVSDLTATCEQTASAFESRQQLRADEIVAIEKAINIISGTAVAGNAQKHLPTLLEVDPSFAQIASESSGVGAQKRVATYLQAQAEKLHSRVLRSMAAHVSEDPFGKVKKMLKDLIVRLMEEANEEMEHKGWCTAELSTNQQTRNEKTNQVESLHAEVDQLQASISKMTEEISEFTQAVADLDAAMAEASKLRSHDKAKNVETISDAQEAQIAVAQALTVLKELYAKAAESTALVQQKEVFGKPYKGMQSETGGVVGMLEVIQSDFARLQSETQSAEVAAQRDYDEFMSDSKVDKSQKSADIEHKIAKKQDEAQQLTQKTQDLDGAQKELNAALAYFEKLKPSCVESGLSYEDRAGRRKDEISSLQEALRILNGEDIA